ncbi:hypothetical protein [Mesorhizobium sp. M0146]|uniref:beta strand repeat-containing protein n=1 Tax=unclassified Mesorhizobium TaxID=325217 RepID=UPI00333ACDC3
MTSTVYSTGTVSVTNGNAVVTGIGTAWAVSLVTGGMFTRLGVAVPILSVESDTSLTLAYAWPGVTAAGSVYAIDRTNSDAANVVSLNATLSRVLVTLSLAGITPDASGSLADRAAITLGVGDKGFLFLHAEIGVAFAFYRWSGTAWDGPFPVANSAATGGVSSLVAGTGVTVDNTNPAIPVVSGTPAASIHAATGKTTPVDADELGIADSAASFALKKLTWANLKATLWTAWGSLTNGGTGKATPVDADLFAMADSAASNATKSLSWANLKATLKSNLALREVLTTNRTYYVGYNMGSATVSIASPGVVTKTSHGLVAGSRVAFSILPNTKTATVSVASPAVVTMTNTFAAGQPIVFATTGRLPKGLVAGTTYYVIATGLSGSSFQVSATVGGAAINTSNPTFTVTIASPGVVTETAHGRSTGDAIQLATTGALPTGLAAATTYFLNVIDANTYNLRLTPEGANINTSGTQSGTHSIVQFGTHYLSETGTLPTGITAGQDYFVIATGLTANAFQFSATSGGAAINTTGSTAGTIVLKTGSDSNSGLAQTAAGAFLTLGAAIGVIKALDLDGFSATVQVAAGIYLSGINLSSPFVGGLVSVIGDTTTPSNVVVSVTSGSCFVSNGGGVTLSVSGFKLQTTTSGQGIWATNKGQITVDGKMDFGACAGGHMLADNDGGLTVNTAYNITGGSGKHLWAEAYGLVACVGKSVSIIGVPAFSVAFAYAFGGYINAPVNTFSGNATGTRYNALPGGVINTNTAGITYLPGSAAGTGTNPGTSPFGMYN